MKKATAFLKKLKGRKIAREDEAKTLLKHYGIPTTDFLFISQEKDLRRIGLRYPLVLKVCSSKILHKTEAGGVRLNIQNVEELAKAFKEMQSRFPDESFLLETMEKGDIEIIVGLMSDETFGMSIMLGLGGIFTEVYRDVTFRVVPITRSDAEEMMKELKGKDLLMGFRGLKVDREGIIDLLIKTSNLGKDFEGHIQTMDLNPVLVRQDGLVVVDAKLVLK